MKQRSYCGYGPGEILVFIGALLFFGSLVAVTIIGLVQILPDIVASIRSCSFGWLLLTPFVGATLMFLGAWVDSL